MKEEFESYPQSLKNLDGAGYQVFAMGNFPDGEMPEFKLVARSWRPQFLIDDLQEMIDEEPDTYTNDRRTTLCMARDYLKEYFSSEALFLFDKRKKLADLYLKWAKENNVKDCPLSVITFLSINKLLFVDKCKRFLVEEGAGR